VDLRRAARRLARAFCIAVAIGAAFSTCQVMTVRFVDPHVTKTMIDQTIGRGRGHGDWTWPSQQWRELDDLGQVPLAVLSAEDQRFWLHAGFDHEAILDAIEWNRDHPERTRGASTITQQVARNVFLWQERSWLRKGLEVWYTALLELLVPKERILELYLNVAETGPAQFGFEAAALHWYGKPADDLTPWEAATLAGCLPSPRRWKPTDAHVVKRARWIRAHPAPRDRAQALEAEED